MLRVRPPLLAIVGDVMLDVTVAAGTLARGGDVHGDIRFEPGGSASNIAVWAAQAGAEVLLVGCVGDDVPGRVLREELASRRVDARLHVIPGVATGAMLVVTEAGERSMVARRGANSRLAEAHLPDPFEASAVFVSGYTLFDQATQDVAREALRRARAPIVAIDAASWPLVQRRGAAWFFEATRTATLLFANEHEAAALSGRHDEAAARVLAARYDVVVVKLGARGAVMAWRAGAEASRAGAEAARAGAEAPAYESIHVPAPEITEVDPTGAGDAFDGVFLATLAAGGAPGEALRRACEAGAQCAAQQARWPERED
jgi:sugar/nucleoside kinase (ribokinase family)